MRKGVGRQVRTTGTFKATMVGKITPVPSEGLPMNATSLPVPDLDTTLRRFLEATGPLTSEPARAGIEASVEDFSRTDGPLLQEKLREFADSEAERGQSYLSEAWTDGYLEARTPLALTSNVGFQIVGDFGAPGSGRAAQLIYRAAAIHLAEVRGETPQEVDGRGTEVDMRQWECLRGGTRHPQADRDEVRFPETAAAGSEIGIVHRGRMFAVGIADEEGQPVSVDSLRDALQRLIAESDSGEGAGGPVLPFTAVSYLGSGTAAGLLEELTASPRNAQVYERLTRLLFVVSLMDEPADNLDHLHRMAFEPDQTWIYKPVTYDVCLADDWMGIHFEHSTADGATVRAAISRMQELEVPSAGPAAELVYEELAWETGEELRHRVEEELEDYRRQAENLHLQRIKVPRISTAGLEFKVSDDALQQFILLYAQLAVYGKARSVYEAVDMREYQAGRTECLRPVTAEAVEFIGSLVAGAAGAGQFTAALDKHREWVKACKSGQGIDRHLLGLELTARRTGTRPAFFDGDALRTLRHDFLSTTSLGNPDAMSRYAFAPTTPEGFGVGYVNHPDSYEFTVSYWGSSAENPQGLLRGIEDGGRALGAFMDGLRGGR